MGVQIVNETMEYGASTRTEDISNFIVEIREVLVSKGSGHGKEHSVWDFSL